MCPNDQRVASEGRGKERNNPKLFHAAPAHGSRRRFTQHPDQVEDRTLPRRDRQLPIDAMFDEHDNQVLREDRLEISARQRIVRGRERIVGQHASGEPLVQTQCDRHRRRFEGVHRREASTGARSPPMLGLPGPVGRSEPELARDLDVFRVRVGDITIQPMDRNGRRRSRPKAADQDAREIGNPQ